MVKHRRKRMVAMKLIIERLRTKGPAFPSELMQELGIADRTVDYNLNLMVNLGIAKKFRDNRYAWIEYRELEEEVQSKLKRLRDMLLREPTVVEFAEEMRITPERAKEYLYELTKDYREPTPEDIDVASEDLAFKLIIVSLLKKGVKEIFPYFTEGYLEFADHRTENFPELVPKTYLHKVERKDNRLHIWAWLEWSDIAKRILGKYAEFEKNLEFPEPPSRFVRAPPSYRATWKRRRWTEPLAVDR